MKRTLCMAAAFVCAATLGAMAQTPSTTTSSAATTAADKITVTGCLQAGASRSTTGNTATDASSGMASYTLMTSPSSSSTTASAAGTTASSSTTAATGTSGTMNSSAQPAYLLDGRDSELKNHVGHRIEVTGTVDNHGDHAAGSTATSTTTSGSASSRMSDAAPTLKVSSVRMISADCSAK